jgi:hypothetical protein
MPETMTAADVKAAIHKYHGMHTGDGMWTCVNEAFSGWNSSGGGVDVMAFGAWTTAKVSCLESPGVYKTKNQWKIDTRWPTVAYEVKVSRADYKREIHGYTPGPNAKRRSKSVPPWPGKASFAIERAHYFVFAVPQGLFTDEEIGRREDPADNKSLWLPPDVGLVEVRPSGTIKVRAKAVPSAARPLTAGEVGEVIRHGLNTNKDRLSIKSLSFIKQAMKNSEKRSAKLQAEAHDLHRAVVRMLMVKNHNDATPFYLNESLKPELIQEYKHQVNNYTQGDASLEEIFHRARIKFYTN